MFFISSLALLFHLTIAMHRVKIIIIKLCPIVLNLAWSWKLPLLMLHPTS
jgi:hypothetical protein